MELRRDILCFQITLQECKIEPAAEPRFKYAERSFFCQSVQEAGLLKIDMAALCHSSVGIVVELVVLFRIWRTGAILGNMNFWLFHDSHWVGVILKITSFGPVCSNFLSTALFPGMGNRSDRKLLTSRREYCFTHTSRSFVDAVTSPFSLEKHLSGLKLV